MKKRSILIKVIGLLALINTLAFSAEVLESYTNVKTYYQTKSLCTEFRGQQIDNGGYIEIKCGNIGNANAINFYGATSSSGNITTANISWTYVGFNDEVTSETLTSGTDINDLKSNNLKVRWYNPVATTINVTMNFMITLD